MGASHPKPFLPERQTSTMDSTSFERLLESGLPRDDMAPSHAGKAHGSSPHADSATSHTLESELDLLANSLKRKRSDSRDDPNGQKRNPPPPQLSEGRKRVDSVTEETSPATGGARERIVPIVGSSAEHPIELDDGTPEAAASDSSDPTARRETIVIDDDDWLDVEDVPSSIPAVRYAAKKLRRAEQRGAAPARVPLLPRKRRTTPAVQSQRGTIPVGPRQSKNYPELRIDDPEFLRAREHVEKVIEYTFERSELLLEALYPDRSKPVMIAGQLISYANYRLALLGDSVLKTALIDSRMQEGESLKATADYAARLGTNMVLARIAIHHGLQGYAGLPHPDLTKRSEVHILGTLIEAIIAAVWTDTNRDLHAVKRLLLVLYGFMGR